MPKKIQNFAKSALVKPITINVGRAGAASLDVIQVCSHPHISFMQLNLWSVKCCYMIKAVSLQEVEYVKEEAKMVYLLECLQKTSPPVSASICCNAGKCQKNLSKH